MIKFTFKCETDEFADQHAIYRPLAKMEFAYDDIGDFEIHNDALAYKIAEIAREELEALRKEKFLRENQELVVPGTVTSSEPE